MAGIRNIVLDGKRTSMRLEDEIWAALKEIAVLEGLTLNELCSEVARRRQSGNLSSTMRVFAMNYYRLRGSGGPWDDSAAGEQLAPTSLGPVRPREKRQWTRPNGTEEALLYDIDELLQLPNPTFRKALTLWHAFRPPQPLGLPSRDDVWAGLQSVRANVPKDAEEQSLALNLIDVRPENPHNFVMESLQSISSLFAGKDMSRTPIGEHPFPLHSEGMQIDFNRAKAVRKPELHVLRQTFEEMRRHYARLILPLSNGGFPVGAILTVTSRLSAPKFRNGADTAPS